MLTDTNKIDTDGYHSLVKALKESHKREAQMLEALATLWANEYRKRRINRTRTGISAGSSVSINVGHLSVDGIRFRRRYCFPHHLSIPRGDSRSRFRIRFSHKVIGDR